MILVTGGTGFVGPYVIRALRDRDLAVRALVRSRANAGQLERQGCEVVVGDMVDAASLRRAVEGCEVVVHLVAILVGRPQDFERVMTQGTRDLVAAARAAGVRRFVHQSALGVNEQTRDLVPYYRAKWDMEEIVRSSGIEWVIFRPSFVFGPDGGALPTFLRLARLGPVTPIAGSGEQRIQPIWVEDVAAHIARAVDEPGAANRMFELGGPDAVPWNEFWARARRVQGRQPRSIHIPMRLMRAQATLLERLPNPLVTRDQLKMLQAGDNTCDVRPALETFGLSLLSLDEQLRRAVAARA